MLKSHRLEVIIIWVVWFVFMCMVSLLFLRQANAQSRNTVYQGCGDSSGGWDCDLRTTGTIPLGTVTNIGQLQHIGVLELSDGAGTCTAGEVIAVFEGSFTGVVGSYVAFGQSSTVSIGSTAPFKARFNAQGTFPFVRANIIAFDTANCEFDFFYSGSITASAITATVGTQEETGLIVKTATFTGAQSDTKVLDIDDTCGSSANPWFIQIVALSGMTSDDGNVVTFKWCDPAGCATDEENAWGPLTTCTGVNWQLNPYGGGGVWAQSTKSGYDFNINTTGAGTVSFNYVVRCVPGF